MQKTDINAAPAVLRDVYTVTRLNREVKAVLEGSFPPLWVQGEISNLARPASGHLYFSLKDAHSQVRCALFRGRGRLLKFAPENGMEVILRANVSLYEGRGEFQLIAESMEPAGVGALQLAFEQLKDRLQAEGLFEEARKRPLPAFPRRIGVVTSPSGAAVRDILHVLGRRYRRAGVVVYPVPVQGAGSAEKIAAALETANRRDECDVLVLARGGGSLEDLWSFNEERVARAVAASAIPVVTGVGHETDFTIADFVADRRAPTPSAAAETVSPNQTKLLMKLEDHRRRLAACVLRHLESCRRALEACARRLPDPVRRLQAISQRLDDTNLRMIREMHAFIRLKRSEVSKLRAEIKRFNPVEMMKRYAERNRSLAGRLRHLGAYRVQAARERLEGAARSLHTVSPLATLERGYAIVTDPSSGAPVSDVRRLRAGQPVRARLRNGSFNATVTGIEKNDP